MSKAASKMDVSRHAARLFAEKGVEGTTGDDIAAAAGVSTRTVWRYFRSKESCVEPFMATARRSVVALLRNWPHDVSLEEHLQQGFTLSTLTAQEIEDGLLAVHLLAKLPDEPGLRAPWLECNHDAERQLVSVIADRLVRSPQDFEVRLCAATVMAAIRVVDETISHAAVRDGVTFSSGEVVSQMARSIRMASALPFCDPVRRGAFGP